MWKISRWFNSETIWHTFSSISSIHFLPMKGKDWPCLPSMNWKQMSLLSCSKPYMPLEGCSLSFHLVMLLNLSHIIIQKLGLLRDGPRQRAKGARVPPGSKNFFFLVYKIFIKKAWAPWFLAWAPLTSPIPVPASQPRSFQEPMKTLKNIYICVKKIKKKKKKEKKKKT